MNLNDIPKNLPELNRFVRSIWPDIRVKRGKGYFYIYSPDEATDLKIAGLYSSSLEGIWPLESTSFKLFQGSIQDTLDDWQRFTIKHLKNYN